MAGTTRRSVAGGAAAAARKVISRRSPGDGEAATADARGAATSTAAKTTARKSTARTTAKTSAKKGTTKQTAARTAAKKTAAKKAPAEAAAKKTAAKKSTAKKAPAEAAVKKTAAKKAPAGAAAKKSTAKKSTAKQPPAKKSATSRAKKKPTAEAAASLVVGEDEDAWTKAELDEVLAGLNADRARLVAEIQEAEHELVGLMRDAGDGAGQDQADIGASSFERDHELTVVNNEREMVAQVDRALARIEDGSYGRCESCGGAIGKNRLMAFPRATLCLSCKKRQERR